MRDPSLELSLSEQQQIMEKIRYMVENRIKKHGNEAGKNPHIENGEEP